LIRVRGDVRTTLILRLVELEPVSGILRDVTFRRENISIEIAIVVSLLLHGLTFGVYQNREALARIRLFKPVIEKFARATSAPPAQRAPAVPVIQFVDSPPPAEPPVPAPPPKPNIFIETDERQATTEQPPNTPYYSDRATLAANPENPTGKAGDTPYLAGEETRMMSTENVPVPRPGAPAAAPPAPPSPPPAAPAEARPPAPAEKPPVLAQSGLRVVEQQRQSEIQRQENIRNTARLGPETTAADARPPVPPQPPAAPAISSPTGREIAAGKSRLVAAGVDRTGVAAFNVAASPFGAYDRKLIQAVQSRWIALIERYGVYERAGTVTLSFLLSDDGKVANLQRKENSAGEMLALFCEKAITDAAPYDPLPDQLRPLVGKEPREVNFTFYY